MKVHRKFYFNSCHSDWRRKIMKRYKDCRKAFLLFPSSSFGTRIIHQRRTNDLLRFLSLHCWPTEEDAAASLFCRVTISKCQTFPFDQSQEETFASPFFRRKLANLSLFREGERKKERKSAFIRAQARVGRLLRHNAVPTTYFISPFSCDGATCMKNGGPT